MDGVRTPRLRFGLGGFFLLWNLFLLQVLGYPLWHGLPIVAWVALGVSYVVVIRPRLRTYAHRLAGPATCALAILVLLLLSEGILAAASWTVRRHSSGQTAQGSRETMRILCVGDSNTYGIGAPKGKSYPDQFAKILAMAGISADVRNAGRPGANTGQVYRILKKELQNFRPNLVLILAGANNFWNQLDIPPEWIEESLEPRQVVNDQILGEIQRSRVVRLLTMAVYSIRTGLPIGVPGSIKDETGDDWLFDPKVLENRKWDWSEAGEILDSEKGRILRLFFFKAFATDDLHDMKEWASHRQGSRMERIRDGWGHFGWFLLSREPSLVKYARKVFEETLEQYPDSAWSVVGLMACNGISNDSEVLPRLYEELTASAPEDIRPLITLLWPQKDDSLIEGVFGGAVDRPSLDLSAEDIRRMVLEHAMMFGRSDLFERILSETNSKTTSLSPETRFVYRFISRLKDKTPYPEVENLCASAAGHMDDPWSMARTVYHLNSLGFSLSSARLLDDWMVEHDPTPKILILRLLTLLLTTGTPEKIEEVAANLKANAPEHPWAELAQAYALFARFKREHKQETADKALEHAILAAKGHAHYDFFYARAINLLTPEMQRRFLEETLPSLPCQVGPEHSIPTGASRVRSLENGILAMLDLCERYKVRVILQGYLTDYPNARIVERVAAERNALYVRHSVLATAYKSRLRSKGIYAPDGHPNEIGYGLMAAHLYQNLVADEYLTPQKTLLPSDIEESQDQ